MAEKIDNTGKESLDILGLDVHLNEAWKRALLDANGNLKIHSLRRQLTSGHQVPTAFITALKALHPGLEIPPLGTAGSGNVDVPDTRDSEPHVAENKETEKELEEGSKRKRSWFIKDLIKVDELNEREADGTLKPLKKYSGAIESPSDPIPDEITEFWTEYYEMSSKPFYDAETMATGNLDKSEYFIIPSNWEVNIRPIKDVGRRHETAYNEVDDLIMASIYAFAKEQAIELKMCEDDQIKWACIRLEAFKAGWFDNQKFTMRKKVTTATNVKVFENDINRIREIQNDAWTLCNFLPYMAEFHFRTYGSTYGYNTSSASDYVSRAQSFSTSLKISNLLAYMDHDTLYSKALGWIVVKRPMQVLRNNEARLRIPSVFLVREKWGPAGQAIITTSARIIRSLEELNWWGGIQKAGNYNDAELMSTAGVIIENPWKYHMMHNAYGVEPPTKDEMEKVKRAKELAITFAPILQAYIDVVEKKSDLGKVKVLKRHSDNNMVHYIRFRNLFRKAVRMKAEKAAEELFGHKESH